MNIDFHVHTYHSYDSRMRPVKILQTAKKMGLDGIVVCDHNTIRGALEVSRLNKDNNFIVIIGAEIKTNAGDITGIHLTKEIESREVNEVIGEIHSQNGKVILNHPFKNHDLSLIDFSKIDYVEGYNSRLSQEENRKAVELAIKYGKKIIAGSDAHLYTEIGRSYSMVNDANSLIPVSHQYRPSNKIYQILSQYIKAFKQKSFKLLFINTIELIKVFISYSR